MINLAVTWWTKKARRSMRNWLRKNPKYLQALRKSRCFNSSPEAVSRGVAIGLFYGLTPTVGLQTMMALPTCLLLRGNFPLACMATLVTNPLTIPPAYYLFNLVGGLLYSKSLLSESTATAYPWLDVITSETLQFALGSLVIATPVAALGYITVNWFMNRRLRASGTKSSLLVSSDPRSAAPPAD